MDYKWALRTIDTLYAAALGEEEWEPVLNRLSDGMDGIAGTVEIHRVEDRSVAHLETVGLDLQAMYDYMRDYNYNPRSDFAHQFKSGLICHDHLMLTEAEMDHDPFYQELLASNGVRYFVSAQAPIMDGSFIALLSVQRRAREGAVTAEQLALMEILEPHIKRSLSLWWNRVRDRIDPDRLVRRLESFGLTAAECQLARCLALGESLPDYARRNDRSINTIHTHYRRIKEKLDCASQTELLARLHAIKET